MVAAAQTRPAAAWSGVAVAAVRAVVSARTWLALIHLLSGWVIGLVAFGVIVFGAIAGVVLLPFAFMGIWVLYVVVLIGGLFAWVERRRFAVLLDVRIAAPAAPPRAGKWWKRCCADCGSPKPGSSSGTR